LRRLIIIGFDIRRDLGVRTAVTGRAVHPAVSLGVAVEDCSGVDIGDTFAVAIDASGFGDPGNAAVLNSAGDVVHRAVTGCAVPVFRSVSLAPVAVGLLAGMAIVTSGAPGGMGVMDGLGEIFTGAAFAAGPQSGATVAAGTKDRFHAL